MQLVAKLREFPKVKRISIAQNIHYPTPGFLDQEYEKARLYLPESAVEILERADAKVRVHDREIYDGATSIVYDIQIWFPHKDHWHHILANCLLGSIPAETVWKVKDEMKKKGLRLFGVFYTHIGSLKNIYPTLYKQVEKGAKAGETIFVKKDGEVKQFRIIREELPTTIRDHVAPKTILTESNEVYRKLNERSFDKFYT